MFVIRRVTVIISPLTERGRQSAVGVDSPPASRRLLAVRHGGSQGGVGYDGLARVVDGHARHLLPRGRNEDLLSACRPAVLQERTDVPRFKIQSRSQSKHLAEQLVLVPAPACQAECEGTGTTDSEAPGVPGSPSSAGIQRPCWTSAGLLEENKLVSRAVLRELRPDASRHHSPWMVGGQTMSVC